ncbi:MAG: phage tail protein [Sphingobium sp.]|nr:phage tail protein [Sphingobium sp.]
MATLVFTALGTALGGPFGGALGALAGQAVDAQIFKPKGRTGPRLSDLSVQTSRYGAQIPRIFGRMRVAGTVIWSTELKESSTTQGGGKGQPSVTSYSYSASFAVALSSRPVGSIGRIWADGTLLRGSAGDMKAPLGALRLHDGSAGQAVDPLIAAAVGVDQAPAFRGLAYIVLEELQLADFGNRIPSLTVEIIADEGPVTVSRVASFLLGRPITFAGDEEPSVLGYAADGSDIGDALAPLLDSHDLRWRGDGGPIGLVSGVATGRVLARDGALRTVDGRKEAPGEQHRVPLDEVPMRLALRHFDPDRDYQLGVQSSERPGSGRRTEDVGLPAVIAADTARRLADRSLRARLAQRRTWTRASDWRTLDLKPGDIVSVEGETGAWRVERFEWENMATRLSLRAVASGVATPSSGDSGQPLLSADLVQGPTSLALVELAAPDDRLVDTPLVFAAATGADAGWRRAALFRYRAETEIAEPAGGTAARAVLGAAETALGEGSAWTFDMRNSVEVVLDHPGDPLSDASEDELIRGANLCALGNELLQFGQAELLAPGRYRLSRLVRGWHGTEWAMTGHAIGDRFVLIQLARLRQLAMMPADIGQILEMRASGLGDVSPAEAVLPIDGRAILPPSPVHPILIESGGDLQIGWTRRSRLGWSWRDLADVPLAEERETYRVSVMTGGATLREAEIHAPVWTYAAADRFDDLAAAAGEPLRIEIRQLGTFGPSRPLILPIA